MKYQLQPKIVRFTIKWNNFSLTFAGFLPISRTGRKQHNWLCSNPWRTIFPEFCVNFTRWKTLWNHWKIYRLRSESLPKSESKFVWSFLKSAKKTHNGSIWFQKTLKIRKATFLTFLNKGQLISEGFKSHKKQTNFFEGILT